MIFDAHCDVLYKLFQQPSLKFTDAEELHITAKQLKSHQSKVQLFAIFLPPSLVPGERFKAALKMIDLFYERVLAPHPFMKMVKTRNDIENLLEHEVGAMLTLEGCEAIEGDLLKLTTLLRLGVASVGLTWNWANEVADGAMETRGAGLTRFGEGVIQTINQYKYWTDVSHLSDRAFWDTIERAKYPVASHSNSYTICPHPRNLRDDQVRAIVSKKGCIGMTFVPFFVNNSGQSSITDLIRHIERFCELGAANHIGFGSDFDGIDETIPGLSSFKDYDRLIHELHRYYSPAQVNKFLFGNFINALP
ncbi:dipeptidase [Bacillus sp. 2205SS5-2]|uniref:dipeptidase n=1 Tax=Bacillus sp. 2205SS5-2 TaxID=3109031 RepID=UPI003004C20A